MVHGIVHFEIPFEEEARAKGFYQDLFGWSIEAAQDDYNLITVGEPGPNGGMMKRQMPGAGITVYVGVESVDEYAAKVQALGGTVLVPKQPVPSMGYFCVFQDTEGNVLALWEEDASAG